MLASIQPSMQILIAKQQTYTKDMKVCTCHAWRCNKPPRMTNHSQHIIKDDHYSCPGNHETNQPWLSNSSVVSNSCCFTWGLSGQGLPHGAPQITGTLFFVEKPLLILDTITMPQKMEMVLNKLFPKKHGMNLENTRHQMIYLYFHDEIRVLVTWNTMWVAAHVRRTPAELRWNRLTSLECWVMKEPCDLSNQGHQRDQMAFVKGLTGNWETCILTTKKHLKPLDPPA